jgi:Ca2+-binding RTX toxin-like protein
MAHDALSIVVNTGEVFGLANDATQVTQQVNAGSIAGAIAAASAIAQSITRNPAISEALRGVGLAATATQLTADIAALNEAIATGNDSAAISAALGLVAGVGSIISTVPTPQTRAIGIAINLTATAARNLYDRRQAISDALRDLNDLLEPVDGPIIDIDPQTAIDYGLLDPNTLLPRIPLTAESAAALAERIRSGNLPGRISGGPDPSGVNGGYHGAAGTRRAPRDPLAIDLDGDGIETIGVGTSPVLFDHNADGIRNGTGWVRPDDAWLALDRDGNGAIDSGRELFGVDTVLSGTPGVDATYAATGFEALRTLDANGDLVFNDQDAAFTQVRLWRDLNQDGTSQASELTTLAAQGIASIALTESSTTINLGNGNTVSGTATVTRSNGTTTHVDAVGVTTDITAGNLNLANNPFYREFTTPVALTTTAQALPEMGGSGWVRDLREAMSLGTPQAAALTAAVQQFAAATTRDAQMALLDTVLRAWAETNQSRAMGPVDDPLRRFVLAGNADTSAQLQWALPILEVFNGLGVTEAGLQAPTSSTNAQGQTVQTFNLISEQVPGFTSAYSALRDSVYSALVTQTRLRPYLDAIDLVIDETGVRFDTTSLATLLNDTHATDSSKSILDLFDLVQHSVATLDAVGFDWATPLSTWVAALDATSPLRAELIALNLFVGAESTGTSLDDVYAGDANGNVFQGGAGSDLANGAGGNDTLSGGGGDDQLSGGAGNDLLQSGTGYLNVLDGGDGDDTLRVEVDSGAATLRGGAGNDNLGVNFWTGSNTFEGGTGNDTMAGGYNADTYVFNLGDGADTISDNQHYTAQGMFSDRIVFGAGIAPSDITVSRSGSNLVLRHANGADQITVANWFATTNGTYFIEQIEFANGTVWNSAELTAANLVVVGTAGDDNISGTVFVDVINGAGGNDTLSGGGGDDQLSGGAGNDLLQSGTGYLNVLDGGDGDDTLRVEVDSGAATLRGGAGNDNLGVNFWTGSNTFEGGTGNDTMAGGYNADTYVFNLGDGADTISDNQHYTAQGMFSDRIVFGAGIAPSDITVSRSGSNLVLRHANGADQITVANWFGGNQYQIERIEFNGGVVWDAVRIEQSLLSVLSGTVAGDLLNGTAGADQLTGLEGNDTLVGNAGHDLLDGGLGADAMSGSAGDDVYVVDSAADGVNEAASEGIDSVRSSVTWTLGANVEHLVLTGVSAINGTGNSLDNDLYGNSAVNALAGGIGNDRYYVGTGDTVTEGTNAGTDTVYSTTTWTLNTNVEHLTLVGTAAINGTGNTLANTITGNDAANAINGGTGADTLVGGRGDDTYTVDNVGDVVTELAVQGIDRVSASVAYTLTSNVENLTLTGSSGLAGTGNDLNNVIIGNSGANTLVGGLGNDRLDGGTGIDTMTGGVGNDTFVVNVAGDVVNENASEGTDAVESLVTWTLGNNLENLTLIGTSVINGTGNALNNVLIGNAAANALTGGEGNDTYGGNAGNDTLSDTSTSSNEVYRWGIGQGNDTIADAGGTDRIEIAAGVSASQVTLTRSTNDLRITVSGASDVLTVKNWYTSSANRIEEIRLADGSTINAGVVAPLSVAPSSTVASREVVQMRNEPHTGVLRIASAVLVDEATAARNMQMLVEAMASFTGRADSTTPTQWQRIRDPMHVTLANPM